MAPFKVLHHEENANDLVQDGSVDLKGRPVRRSQTGGWKACCFIIVDELSERLAFYGIQSNLITYLTKVLHQGLASSARSVSNWVGVTYVVTVVGAFMADVFWGRYWTIAALSVVYVLGLVSLTLSVSLRSLRPPACASPSGVACSKANSAQLGVFFFSLYVISIGTGGVKPCLEAFGADQFDEEDPKERRRKSSFFNLWNFGLCVGALTAFSVLVYVQDNQGWGIGFGIPAGAMAIALCVFVAGTRRYRHKQPGGSPLTRVLQVFVAAIRNWRVQVPLNASLLHETIDEESLRLGRRQLIHTLSLGFLDKAAVQPDGFLLNEHPSSVISPWKLCTVTQIEEVKLLVRIVPVWLACFMYGVVSTQMSTFFTKQGSTMDRHLSSHFNIPPASLQTLATVVILILLPIYDRVFVPAARRLTGHERGITLLQRIGTGLFVSVLCLIIAAVTELKRRTVAAQHGLLDSPNETIPLSIAWLLPQYALVGVSDVFAIVGQQEFFYDQMPDALRSLGMALYLCAAGMGGFLSSILIAIVDKVSIHGSKNSGGWLPDNLNRSHLDYFYWLLAVLGAINLLAFMIIAHFYTYKKAESVTHTSANSVTCRDYELKPPADYGFNLTKSTSLAP